jgi:predicted N-acetyltransferase YhbS
MTREAFWKFWEDDRVICDEHLLVNKLRSAKGFIPELNYVAETGGQLVGHIICSKSKIISDEVTDYETLTFGPLTVMPEYQNKGIGKMLMRHTFAEAKRLGYRAVLIFGNTDYYSRIGFQPAAEFGITTSDGSSLDAFMAYPLYESAFDGIRGRYFIDPVYEQLSQEEALEFDKQFPPKERHSPIPIGVLLDRLESEAAMAIQRLNMPSLNYIHSKSEREISSLPGMDEVAVETIRSITRENGIRWGK